MEVSPGFESIRSAVSQSLGKHGLTIVSSGSAIQLRIQEAFVDDPEFSDARACGMIDLLTVSQLVSKLTAVAGVPTTPTLDLDRQASLIGLVSRGLSDESAFAGSKHLPGFYAAAAATLQEMRHERVRLDSLAMPAGKLRDIALLQEGLDDELARRSYSTLSDRIEALITASVAKPNEIGLVLWLPEREWPELRMKLLEWMLRAGIDVTLAADRHPSNEGFFSATSALRKRFPDATISTKETHVPPGGQLFARGMPSGTAGNLTILEASDDFIEAEWVLRSCRRRIRNDGLDAGDIVVFARSLETYGPLLRAASDREGLPILIDYSEKLSAHPFTRYVQRALRSMFENSLGDAIALLRSSYGQVERSERSGGEKALRDLAREPDLWRAIGEHAKEAASPIPGWMAEAARWRRIAIEAPKKPADWMRGLDQLLAVTPWLQSSSQREESAKDGMVRSLNVGLLALDPYSPLSFREFVEFVERTWASAEYRVRTTGGIRVVSDPQAIGEAKVVIAVGVIEGRFPSRRAEDPVLLDRDRDALGKIDPSWKLADSYSRAEEDERDFYRLLCSSFDLTLCYPASVGEESQDPAAYLWQLQAMDGVTFEKRTFSQRFPKAEDCNSEQDMLASIIWHGQEFEPRASITARAQSLRDAYVQSQVTTLKDDILRAKLGILPHPVKLSHLRSLAQCPFQYFARHKLSIRSEKGDHANKVIVNSIRRSNFQLSDLDDFRKSLLQSLNIELESLQGVLSDHEMQVIRFAAPTTLEQFAKMEMNARRQWKLTPVQVAPADDQTGLRRTARFGDAAVTLSPGIDVLYKRDGTNEIVPMRIGWESEEEQTKLENHLVALMHPGDKKFVMFDAYNNSRRTLYCRRTDGMRERLDFRGNLAVDLGPKQIVELRRDIKTWMMDILNVARSGAPNARPKTNHCDRCDLGSLCRAAPYADPDVDWMGTIEDEPE